MLWLRLKMGGITMVTVIILSIIINLAVTEARGVHREPGIIGKAQRFCRDLRTKPGILENCADLCIGFSVRKCVALYMMHGEGAECHITKLFADTCAEAMEEKICEATWREQYNCPNRPGSLITTPNVWSAGEINRVCVDLHDIFEPTKVEISLQVGGVEAAGVWQTLTESACLDLVAPENCTMTKQELVVTISNYYYSYTDRVRVVCSNRGSLIFIQTSQPIYKPGTNVSFRIMNVKLPKLIPDTDPIDVVSVSIPGGTKISQQTNVATNLGLVELSVFIDEFALEGTYTIEVSTATGSHQETFDVQKFVLPKWDVTVTGPSKVFPGDTASYTICALYTFGQPVSGTYNLAISTINYYSEQVMDSVVFDGAVPDSGCFTAEVNDANLEGMTAGAGLIAKGFVIEELTDTRRDAATEKIRIEWPSRNLIISADTSRFFKIPSPIYGMAVIQSADSQEGVEATVELTVNNNVLHTQTVISDADGDIPYTIPANLIPEGTTRAQVKVTAGKIGTTYSYLQAWFSSSDSFVTIKPPCIKLPCDEVYNFHVDHNAPEGAIMYYKVISKGSVVASGSQMVAGVSGVLDLPVEVTSLMSGKATILVHFVIGFEFVSDYSELEVEECFANQVDFDFSTDQAEPGEEVMYELKAAGESLCSIGVVDKSLEILAGRTSFILPEDVFNVLKTLGLGFTYGQFPTDEKYCTSQDDIPDECKATTTTTSTTRPPLKEGEIIEEEIAIEAKPAPIIDFPIFPGGGGCSPRYFSNYVDSSQALNAFGVFAVSDLVIETRPCEINEHIYCYAEANEDGVFEKNLDAEAPGESVAIRKFFPESFLWRIVYVPAGEVVSEPVTVPDTITEWRGNAFCMNSEVGLGISDFASIITFRNFFILLNLPFSITSGETVHIQAQLFNFLPVGECVALRVTLSEQPTFAISGDDEFTICLCGQESTLVKFIITPTPGYLGDITLTVVAVSITDEDICEDPLSSKSINDGVEKLLPVKAAGDPQSYSWSRFLCAGDTVTAGLPLPAGFVPGSERKEVSVIGTVMGSALENLDNLIQMPMGCGEQTIYLTGQSAIVYKYLTATGEATPEATTKAIKAMESGYQREMNYKHSDGSYSVWGPPGIGSNWLTLFVIRVFAISQEFIYIDPAEQTKSINYLKGGQLPDGCFPQLGTVIHTNMQGGLTGSTTAFAMTGSVLVALLETGVPATDPVIVNAIGCLSDPDVTQMTTYALAISAYAFTLFENGGGSSNGRLGMVLAELDTRAIVEGGMKYWSAGPPPVTSCSWCQPPSFDIEMTSYVLLAVLNGPNPVAGGLPIVRWLTSQRNSFGGWGSTQDTFMGLLALSTFAEFVLGDSVDVNINIMPPNINFHIDQTNAMVLQTEDLGNVASIDIAVTGDGCAIVKADVFYNILNGSPADKAFDIDVTVTEDSNNCNRKTISTCTTYLGADLKTGMALVEVKALTGHGIDEGSLPNPDPMSPPPPGQGDIQRVEVNQDIVTVYYDKLTDTASCFKFQVLQEEVVDNVKPGYVLVLDYYETSKKTVVEYIHDVCPIGV